MSKEPVVIPRPPNVETDGTLAAHRYLLEVAFTILSEIHPGGPSAIDHTLQSIRQGIRSAAAIPMPQRARDVLVSDAAERELEIFLASFAARPR